MLEIENYADQWSMKQFTAILIPFLLAACAKSSSDSSTATKSLFAIWTRTDLALVLNLTGGSIGTTTMQWTTPSGAKCNSTIVVSGTEASGNYAVSNSSYVAGTGNGDPGCASLDQTGTFSKPGNTLTICTNGTTCATYQ